MVVPRRYRPRLLRRWRMWLTLAFAALWWLSGRLILFGAPMEGATATHRVRAEDTIPRLCWQYKVRAEAIRAANPGVDDPLPVGRKLTIPLGHYEPPGRIAAAAATAAASGRTPKVAVHPASAPSTVPVVPRASPPLVATAQASPRAVVTTRLPPQAADTPAPRRRPVTVISAEIPRP